MIAHRGGAALRSAVACMLVASIGATSLPGFAQDAKKPEPTKAQKDEASERFKKGVALHAEGNLDAALIEFNRAYDLAPNYRVLYNIGVVYRDMKDYAASLSTFEKYLVEGGKQIDAKRRTEVEKEIATLKKLVSSVKVTVSVDGAKVYVDEKEVGTSPLDKPLVVNAGKRKISATKDGMLPASKSLDVAGGDTLEVELKLAEVEEVKPVVAPAPPPPAPPPPPPTPSKFTTLSWVGLGVAAGFAIGAGVTGAMAMGASKDLESERFVGDTPNGSAADQQSKVKTLALVTDVLIGAAIVTAGITIGLTLSRDPKPEPQTGKLPRVTDLKVGVGLGSISLGGAF